MQHRNESFKDERIELHGKFFHDCTFENCELIFDGEHIGGKGHRLTVKVAAGEDLAGVREHERIVGHRVHLYRQLSLDIGKRIAYCAVHLRRTADAVRVLDTDVIAAMRLADRGAL